MTGTRARLGRYALYQLWDYVFERGLLTLLLAAMTLGPQLFILRNIHGAAWGATENGAALARGTLAELALPLAAVAVIFAVNGISSQDRQKGYFRLLFSKPVGVGAYYAQDFVVRFLGVSALLAIVLVVFSLSSGAPFLAGFLGYTALVYVLLGGIGFLLSALVPAIVPFDGLALALVWVSSSMLLQLRRAYPERIPEELALVLPPVDKLDAARDAFIGGAGALPPGHLWWAIGYGLGCFVLGLLVLGRRELAR